MARYFSVGSVIDKNRVTSNEVWVILLRIDVRDPNTREIVDVMRLVANDENVIYGKDENGNPAVYEAANFDISIDQSQNEAPSVSITAQDQMGHIQARMDAMAGGLFSDVTMDVVNTSRPESDPEIENIFQVTDASCKNYVVTFQLGAENPLAIQWPKHRQFQDRCAWRFKGYGCNYTGELTACDYTKDGPMGCHKHFEGKLPARVLPGLVRMNM